MITNYTESGWQIITQRSHGLLAAQLCAHWKKSQQGPRWVETLIAVAEHDDVYNEFENEDLLNEMGGRVNFKMTVFRREYGQRLIQLALSKSTWIALLVSRHIQFVYGKEPLAADFIKALKSQESAWKKILQVSDKAICAAYELLQFCDAFSLVICQGLVPPEQRELEISAGPGQVRYRCRAKADNQLQVSPWPFEEPSVQLVYESRTVSSLTFKDTASFRKEVFQIPGLRHELILIPYT